MPLMRYPGAKGRLVKQLFPHFPPIYQIQSYAEPFIGAGAVFETLAPDLPGGAKVFLCDADPDIAAIWRCVLRGPNDLLALVDSFVPSVDAFYAMRDADGSGGSDEERSLRKIALHQTSFSGLGAVAGGPIGGQAQKSKYTVDCRWSPRTIRKNLTKLHAVMQRLDVHVECGDFQRATGWLSSQDPDSAFCYLDPPYYEKGGACYKHGFSLTDHERLSSVLRSSAFKWALSYDDAPDVRALYPDHTFAKILANYSINGKGRGADVVALGDQADVLIMPCGAGDITRLHYNGKLVCSLQSVARKGSSNFKQIPKIVRELLETDAWKHRVDPDTGENVVRETFPEFLDNDLGEAVAAVRAQIRGEPDLEAMFEDAIKQAPGNPTGANQHNRGTVYNVHDSTDAPAPAPPAPKGNARARAVLKLRTEAERPDADPKVVDAWDRVKRGEIKPHRGMVDAGFRKEVTGLDMLRKGWRKATDDERRVFLEEISRTA